MRLRRQIVAASAVAALVACSAISATAAPLASLANSPAGGPWSLAPGEYYTELSGSSFQSGSSFDDGSVRRYFAGEQQQIGLQSYSELGWTKRWSFQLSIPLVTNTVRGATGPGVSITGLGDVGLGLRYRIVDGPTATSVQLRWDAPAGYDASLAPPLGDGLQKLSATLQLGLPGFIGPSFMQFSAGYRYDYETIGGREAAPTTHVDGSLVPAKQNWADHATFGAAMAAWKGRLQVAYLGAADIPLQTGRVGPAGDELKVQQLAHGPRLTYRTDERIDTFAGCWLTAAGKNSPYLTQYYAGVAWKSTKLNRLQGFIGGDARP
jgi:hypothetical protein